MNVRIFVSSPGDVAEEREIARRVVERVTVPGLRLEPVFWEHEPLRASAGFQEQLPLPADCDIVVVILWSRLGTRLPARIQRADGSRYDSGTEFEFENALESHERKGVPDLLVYRKVARLVVPFDSEAAVLERLDQKRALDAFLEKWFRADDGSFTAAFHPFETTEEFETLLEAHLRKLVVHRLPQEAAARAARARWREGSPFRGLQPFDVEHAPIFFGRTGAVSRVLSALRAQAARGHPFVLILGMSGCGKSSLARAGVLPLLTRPGVIEGVGLWRCAVARPADAGADPFASLAGALLRPGALPELGADGTTIGRLADMLRDEPETAFPLIKGGLSQAAAELAREQQLERQPRAHLALLVDQLEELFTTSEVGADDRVRFAETIAALARSGRVWILATLRSDFYPRCAELPALSDLKEATGQLDLAPPTPDEMAQMIRRPAELAGLEFEEDAHTGQRLDDTLRDAACRSPESLPLLQFTLEELYKCRSEEERLTLAAYAALGGVGGALAQRAETAFAGLPLPVQRTLPQVLSALVSVGVGEGEGTTRRRAPLAAFEEGSSSRSLVDAFVAARLFVTDRDDRGRAVVSLAHEALLDHWPRLGDWLDHNRDLLRIRGRLAGAAAQWDSEQRSNACLLAAGRRLAEAAELQRAEEIDLTALEREFLDASLARGRRAWWLKRAAVAALCLLALTAGVAAWLANNKRTEAERARGESEAVTGFLSDMLASVDPAELGRDVLVRDVLDEASRTIDEELASKPLIQARLLQTMGATYRELGAYESARPLLEQALAVRQERLGNDHVDVADSMGNLGWLLTDIGEFDKARSYYESALAIHEEELGPLHSSVAASARNLAGLLEQTGDFEKARELYERALSIDEQLYGPRHRDVAGDLSNLAIVLFRMGDLEGARAHFERALQVREQVLGPDHIEVAQSLNNLGTFLQNLGSYAEARGLLERALRIKETALGPEHVDVASTLINLGWVLQELENYDGARRSFERALAITEESLGPAHPRVASSLDGIATALANVGQQAEARPRYERALQIREAIFGPEHPALADSLNNIGVMLWDTGDLEGALPLLERAVAVWEKAGGPEHPDLVTGLFNLAGVLKASSDFEAARRLYQRALAIAETTHGPNHPEVADLLTSMASLQAQSGDADTAVPLFERALQIREAHLAEDDLRVASALKNLALALSEVGQRARAQALLERATRIAETALGAGDPALADSFYNLACLCALEGDREAALASLRKALDCGFADPAIAQDPDLATLRGDPAFEAIIRRIHDPAS